MCNAAGELTQAQAWSSPSSVLLQAPDPVLGLELIVSSGRAVPLDQPQAGSEGLRAMHLCVPQDVRRKLLEMGAQVDVRSRLGCTALHYMACQGGLSE